MDENWSTFPDKSAVIYVVYQAGPFPIILSIFDPIFYKYVNNPGSNS